mgnify:CR=1 FL=1
MERMNVAFVLGRVYSYSLIKRLPAHVVITVSTISTLYMLHYPKYFNFCHWNAISNLLLICNPCLFRVSLLYRPHHLTGISSRLSGHFFFMVNGEDSPEKLCSLITKRLPATQRWKTKNFTSEAGQQHRSNSPALFLSLWCPITLFF